MQQCFKKYNSSKSDASNTFLGLEHQEEEKNVRSSIIEAVFMVGFFGYRFLTLGNPS